MRSVGFQSHILASHMRSGIPLADIRQEQYNQKENLALCHLHEAD
jgi:hypothetical protein